jgi:hypothetical protein
MYKIFICIKKSDILFISGLKRKGLSEETTAGGFMQTKEKNNKNP